MIIKELALTEEDINTFKIWSRKLIRAFNSITCVIMNGGHELYKVRAKDRFYQQCILCQHETKGWNLGKTK